MSQPINASRRVCPAVRSRPGFTLMELLVVIAIIAVLISFLLPALSSARRESNKAKCLAALRDLGQAFNIYASEFKQTFPVVHHAATDSAVEGGAGAGLLPAKQERHWPDLIAKYAGAKVNMEDMTVPLPNGSLPTQVFQNTWRLKNSKSVIWGCPEWQSGGLFDKLSDGSTENTFQVGYGMNVYAIPSDYTGASGATRHNSLAWISNRSGVVGRYHKSATWGRKSADKLLLADSQVYYVAAPISFSRDNGSGTTWQGYSYPSTLKYVPPDYPSWTPVNIKNFIIDGGRHLRPGTKREAQLGNRGVNVLFADFHAATVSIPEAYTATLYPGTAVK